MKPLLLLFLAVATAVADPLEREKVALAEINELANSPSKEERIHAAQEIAALQSRLTSFDLMAQLLGDSDPLVRKHALRALNVVCSANSFTPAEARKLGEPLKKAVTRGEIERLFEQEPSSERLAVIIEQAAALNSLYIWYPLVSHVEFESWQRGVYAYLILRLTGNDNPLPEQVRHRVGVLVHGLFEPQAIGRVLPRLVDELENLSPAEARNALHDLWSHPVFGNERPMNPNLKLLLRPKIKILRGKVGTRAENQHEVDEAVRILEAVKVAK